MCALRMRLNELQNYTTHQQYIYRCVEGLGPAPHMCGDHIIHFEWVDFFIYKFLVRLELWRLYVRHTQSQSFTCWLRALHFTHFTPHIVLRWGQAQVCLIQNKYDVAQCVGFVLHARSVRYMETADLVHCVLLYSAPTVFDSHICGGWTRFSITVRVFASIKVFVCEYVIVYSIT